MQLAELARLYRAKSNEELLQMSMDPDQLTVDAQSALKGELAARRLEPREVPSWQKAESATGRGDSLPIAGMPGSRGGGDFVAYALRLYRSHFWLFVKLTVPAVLAGGVVVRLAQWESVELARDFLRHNEGLRTQLDLLGIRAAFVAGYLFSWIVLSCSFGAIALSVNEIAHGSAPRASTCVARLRHRKAGFLGLCLVLFVIFAVALTCATTGISAAYYFLIRPKLQLSPVVVQIITAAAAFLCTLAFSRLGLSIPAFLLENCRVGQSLFRSDELTEGKWLTLAALLAKTLIAGYVAALAPFWLASWIPSAVSLPDWFPWGLTAVSMTGVALVEPPLLIGFALLYEQTRKASTRPAAE